MRYSIPRISRWSSLGMCGRLTVKAATTMELTNNSVALIFQSIPEFQEKRLSISQRSQVYAFLERRIEKLNLKIRSSAYEPLAGNDKLNLNNNFPEALRQWLDQFPPEHKLGFLASALGTAYISQSEQDLFLDIAMAKLREEILRGEKRDFVSATMPLPTEIKRKMRGYPVSHFGAYDALVHKLPLEASRDRDRHASHDTLDGFLEFVFQELSYLVEYESNRDFIYLPDSIEKVKQVARSLLNSHVVLVEDASFSGTRIAKSARRFLDLMKVLFVPYEKLLASNFYQLPRVYLLVVLGTSKAFDAVSTLGTGREGYRPFYPIFGFLFDHSGNTIKRNLPKNLEELDEILPKMRLYHKVKGAIDFFHENYGKRYWNEETGVIKTYKYSIEDLRFGYGGDGWTIVRAKNCPNNSLPLLWYPHTDSPMTNQLAPLFPRIDSHKSHEDSPSDLNATIASVKEDNKGFLRNRLKSIYSQQP
jgi:hypothetical protein